MIKSNPKIFIVDDELLLSEMLTDYLKDQYEGFQITILFNWRSLFTKFR